jgi:hypothetical protein
VTNNSKQSSLFIGVNLVKTLFTNIAVNRLRHAGGPVQERVIQPSTFAHFPLIHSQHMYMEKMSRNLASQQQQKMTEQKAEYFSDFHENFSDCFLQIIISLLMLFKNSVANLKGEHIKSKQKIFF